MSKKKVVPYTKANCVYDSGTVCCQDLRNCRRCLPDLFFRKAKKPMALAKPWYGPETYRYSYGDLLDPSQYGNEIEESHKNYSPYEKPW